MLSIIYSSTATAPFTDDDLAVLLMNSRANNKRLDLTGLLLYKDGHFLQLLEGPLDVVRDRMAIIAADPRHDNVTTLLEEVVQMRRFPDWSMGYEPVTDALTDDIPGYRSLFDDVDAAAAPASGTMMALRQLIGWFQAREASDGS